MAAYIYQRPDWPKFHWDQNKLAQQLAAVRHRQGRLIGRMQALGFPLREEAVLNTLTEDVVKSSEIEGEVLDRDQVRSSIALRLGIEAGAPQDLECELCRAKRRPGLLIELKQQLGRRRVPPATSRPARWIAFLAASSLGNRS